MKKDALSERRFNLLITCRRMFSFRKRKDNAADVYRVFLRSTLAGIFSKSLKLFHASAYFTRFDDSYFTIPYDKSHFTLAFSGGIVIRRRSDLMYDFS